MSELVESPKERRARYQRLAIAAAAAAARVPTAQARSAYLILAETWSSLAKADDPQEPCGATARSEQSTGSAVADESASGSNPEK
jgi:hypothetical protein